MWDELADVLTDIEYLRARLGTGVGNPLRDSPGSPLERPAEPPRSLDELLHQFFSGALLPQPIFELLRDYSRALEHWPAAHACRAEVAALYQALDQNSHVLKENASLLVQQAYNALAWDWDGATALGRRLRQAADFCGRTWFRRLDPPLAARDEPPLRVLNGRRGSVKALAYSEWGGGLASGCQDGSVIVWDAATGEQRRVLEGEWGPVHALAFAPDGRTVAAGYCHGAVMLWDVATGTRRWAGEGHSVWVEAVAFAPDGQTVASGGGDGLVMLWDAATGGRRVLEGHPDGVRAVAFSSDGRTLATAGDRGAVLLWDVATGERLCTLEG